MTVGTFVQPDFQSQTGTTYKTNIDNATSVAAVAGKWFAPRENSPPAMSVVVDKGRVYNPNAVASLTGPGPTTVSIAAPAGNPRIDRIVIDPVDGALEHIQGVEAAAPLAPGIPRDRLPCARIENLAPGSVRITNQDIVDERVPAGLGLGNAARQNAGILGKSVDYTVLPEDNGKTILVAAGSGPRTVTLPDPGAASVPEAFVVTVKMALFAAGNDITVVSAGGRNIDGAAHLVIGQEQDAVTFVARKATPEWIVRGSERIRDDQVTKAKIAPNAVGLDEIAHATQGDLLYWGAGGAPALLGPGAAGQVLTTRGAGANPAWAGDVFGGQLLHVVDEKPAGTNGGTFASGAWRTRELNTVKTNEIAGASLSANQVTLPVGEYFLIARAPARSVSKHKLRWRDLTDAVDVLHGTTSVTQNNVAVETHGNISGRFSVSGTSRAFELQHRAELTRNIDGLGSGANFGVPEVFAEIFFWKVA